MISADRSCWAITRCAWSGMTAQAWTRHSDSLAARANPFAIDPICAALNRTGGYFIARFAASLSSRWCGTRASERCVVTFVARPYLRSSQAPTKTDHDPRGSFGNQNPYAVIMMWYAMTTR
jgi:hypothetical protein